MDVNALRDLVNRMNPERRDNPHKDIWFKPTEDPTVVRVLPNPHSPKNIPFFEMAFHYQVGGERSVVCPKHHDGSPCPICDLADDFRARSGKGKDDPNFQVFKELSAKARVYAPVLIRGRESEGVKLWGFPVSVLQFFVEKAQDPDWGDFTHPTKGRDVTVQVLRPGTNANPSKYPRPTASLKPAVTPLAKSKEEMKEILANVPDFFALDPPLFEIKEYDELLAIVKRIGADGREAEIEVSTSDDDLPSFGSDDDDLNRTTSSFDDDELDSKLDSLLDD